MYPSTSSQELCMFSSSHLRQKQACNLHEMLSYKFQSWIFKSISCLQWIPNYQLINTLTVKSNLSLQFRLLQNLNFLQPWGHPHIVWPLQEGVLIPYLHMLPKTWTFTYHMSYGHYLRLVIQSRLPTWTSDIKQCKTSISIVSMIQNYQRRSQSPIINRKYCNLEFRNLFVHEFSLMMSGLRPWQVPTSNSSSTT